MTYVETLSKKIYVTIQDKLQKLLNLIGDICPPLLQLKEIRLNTMCLALYEEGWYVVKMWSHFIFVPVRLKNLTCSSHWYFVSGIELK